MVPCYIVVEADSLYECIDFGRLDALLCDEGGIFENQSSQEAEIIVRITKDREVDVVEINETGRSLVMFWNFDNIEYLEFLEVLSLHLLKKSIVIRIALLPHVLYFSLQSL